MQQTCKIGMRTNFPSHTALTTGTTAGDGSSSRAGNSQAQMHKSQLVMGFVGWLLCVQAVERYAAVNLYSLFNWMRGTSIGRKRWKKADRLASVGACSSALLWSLRCSAGGGWCYCRGMCFFGRLAKFALRMERSHSTPLQVSLSEVMFDDHLWRKSGEYRWEAKNHSHRQHKVYKDQDSATNANACQILLSLWPDKCMDCSNAGAHCDVGDHCWIPWKMSDRTSLLPAERRYQQIHFWREDRVIYTKKKQFCLNRYTDALKHIYTK